LIPEALQLNFELAAKMNPGVLSSAVRHTAVVDTTGEKNWARPDTSRLMREVKFLMDNTKSFNFQVINGGTNFGFTQGKFRRKGYEPDVTSYD
jgi:hypothetical protein